MEGQPAIRGTRLGVEFILELPATGRAESEILANYPGLTSNDILLYLFCNFLASYGPLSSAKYYRIESLCQRTFC